MSRFIMLFALASYVAFLGATLWLVAFILDYQGIRTSAPTFAWPMAVLIDVTLITIFAMAHSIMARPGFKRIWTKVIPPAAERSFYVMKSSALLALIFVFWQPIPGANWKVEGGLSAAVLAIFFTGLGIVVLATFLLDHFEFTGLRQAWIIMRNAAPRAPQFRTPLLYRLLRHPLQLGIVMMLFAVPHMTFDGLLFAVVMLAYIFIGLRFEERALLRQFGDDYARYRATVPMLFPRLNVGWRRGRHRNRA